MKNKFAKLLIISLSLFLMIGCSKKEEVISDLPIDEEIVDVSKDDLSNIDISSVKNTINEYIDGCQYYFEESNPSGYLSDKIGEYFKSLDNIIEFLPNNFRKDMIMSEGFNTNYSPQDGYLSDQISFSTNSFEDDLNFNNLYKIRANFFRNFNEVSSSFQFFFKVPTGDIVLTENTLHLFDFILDESSFDFNTINADLTNSVKDETSVILVNKPDYYVEIGFLDHYDTFSSFYITINRYHGL